MKVAVLGAGPAGLFSAWVLHRRGVDVTVFEARPEAGGMSRSFQWHGFTCDLGAHRLFTQDESVLRQLLSLVPMGRHIRRSQLYLADNWVNDPVNIVEILYKYFPATAIRIAVDYFSRPGDGPERSFDDFVHHKYGVALNRFFFAPYTEKLFGLPSDQISADWARRKVRISGPLGFLRESSKKHFSYFYYPIRGGYGAISARVHGDIRDHVRLNTAVYRLERGKDRIEAVAYEHQGERRTEAFDHIVSTLPLTALGQMLGEEFSLSYRPVDLVYLLINRPSVSDNHWVYFMDREFAINRLVEFKNLSTADQPPDRTVLCAEVTSEGADVVQRVTDDVARCGFATPDQIMDAMVLHEDHGYAIYDLNYATRLACAGKILAAFANLRLVGRSAEFQHLELDDVYANAVGLSLSLVPVRAVGHVHVVEGEGTVEQPSESPAVHTVVLTFNHFEDTRECLQSLRETNYERLTVVVVDNGSTDGTPEKIHADFPEVELIEARQNLGVPWGYNVGFSHALRGGAEYVLMLNNDTVVHPQMLNRLVDAGQADPSAGILAPKVLYYDDPEVIWAVGGRHRTFPPAHVPLGDGQPSAVFDKPFHLEYALSCGLLIRRLAFEKAGLFDPGYFFQFDDWDFSQRVRAHGLHIVFVPEAQMWHKVSRSTREEGKEARFWRVWGESSARFYRRHGRPVVASLVLHVGYLMARELIKGNGQMLKYFWAGVRDGLSKPLGPIPTAGDMVLPPITSGLR